MGNLQHAVVRLARKPGTDSLLHLAIPDVGQVAVYCGVYSGPQIDRTNCYLVTSH